MSASSSVLRWRFGDMLDSVRQRVERGAVLAIPTESSYGLAVDPRSRKGVRAIYRIKGRDAGKPLPVVIGGLQQLDDLGIDPDLPILSRLAACWPGPVTAVLPMREGAAPVPAAADSPTLAVRVLGHARMRGLLSLLGPLTATSANPSGGSPLLDPAEAAELLAGEDALVIDDGVLPGGPPSTLVLPETDVMGELLRLRVLREGRVPLERLAELVESSVEPGG